MPPPDRTQAPLCGTPESFLPLPARSADIMFCASAFAGIADALKEPIGSQAAEDLHRSLGNGRTDTPFLTAEAVLSNYVLERRAGGYGSYVDEMLNPQSALAKFKPDIVLILLDLEDIAGRLPALCADGIGEAVEAEIEESVAANSATAQKLSLRQLSPDPLSGMCCS